MRTKENLSQEEINMYSRHLILPEVGLQGQLKLLNSKVLIVGTGALGSPAILYLAAAGVGTIGIVDFDTVEFSNLQRQIIHTTNDVGNLKISSAKSSIEAINKNINVITYNEKLTSQNAIEIIKNFDVVVDGTDNFPARYLINDSCVFLNKPFVYGAIFRFEGQVTVFNFENGPCYRCIFPNPPKANTVPSCSEAGVFGVLPGIIGTIQATETIKILLNKGEVLKARLLTLNALKMEFKELKFNKDLNCPVCSKNATIKELIDYEEFCGLKNMEEKLEIQELKLDEFKKLLKNESLELIDIRPEKDFKISNIANSKNIPFETLEQNINKIDNSKKVVFICTIGLKSKEAIFKLYSFGLKADFYSLQGGFTTWQNSLIKD